ncbi:MAG: hypothetical protein KDI80_04760 [Xanthomonadales bacterium]|nr:hypothetical protein [Xanthomonadales bacterium]
MRDGCEQRAIRSRCDRANFASQSLTGKFDPHELAAVDALECGGADQPQSTIAGHVRGEQRRNAAHQALGGKTIGAVQDPAAAGEYTVIRSWRDAESFVRRRCEFAQDGHVVVAQAVQAEVRAYPHVALGIVQQRHGHFSGQPLRVRETFDGNGAA